MTKKPRSHKGENNPNAKLNGDQVLKIKAMLMAGYAEKEIARQFGVSRSIISHIRLGYVWDKQVEEQPEED